MVQLARANWRDDTVLHEDISAGGYGLRPGASPPTWAVWQGGLYRFKFGTGDSVGFDHLTTHGSVPESPIEVHVHWCLDNAAGGIGTDAVQWSLEFTRMAGYEAGVIAAPGAALTVETTVGTDAAFSEYVSSFGEITMAGFVEGGGLILQLERVAVSVGTEYGDDAVLLRVDAHVHMEKHGTEQDYPPFTWT